MDEVEEKIKDLLLDYRERSMFEFESICEGIAYNAYQSKEISQKEFELIDKILGESQRVFEERGA